MKKNFICVAIVIIICIMAICFIEGRQVGKMDVRKCVVAIDVGHGGFDPGKVGVTGSLEKDINLSIAKKLKRRLEKIGITVVLTREKDEDLSLEGEGKKMSDMRERVRKINESKAILSISIHQNSFTQESVKGYQVFYYEGSEQAKQLAEYIQEHIHTVVKDDNHRMAKSNNDYYVLKQVECPIVIVECGFLSNYEEEALLLEEDYQEKLAKGMEKGILAYLEENYD